MSVREVTMPKVKAFRSVTLGKAQALKVLEEAAEVFGAWQVYESTYEGNGSAGDEWVEADLVDECADVIQATCNLLAALGIDDMTEAMERCEKRNRARGRL